MRYTVEYIPGAGIYRVYDNERGEFPDDTSIAATMEELTTIRAELDAVKAQRDELYRCARNAVSVGTDMGIYYDVGAGEMKALENAVNEATP